MHALQIVQKRGWDSSQGDKGLVLSESSQQKGGD